MSDRQLLFFINDNFALDCKLAIALGLAKIAENNPGPQESPHFFPGLTRAGF